MSIKWLDWTLGRVNQKHVFTQEKKQQQHVAHANDTLLVRCLY